MEGTSIREKVTKLDSIRRELLATQKQDGDEYKLFPPPAPAELRAAERKSGSLPPSYRAFLELANAWRGFMRGWTLLGLRRRDTELFFREGLDDKVIRQLPELVPEKELKTLAAREKSDPKVLSPRDHRVIGVDGRGSALVLDELRAKGGEPEVALVKYVWVQRRWPSFGALLDEAVRDASAELERVKEKAGASEAKATKKKGAKGAKAKVKAKAGSAPAVPKLRVVEIRPATKTKGKAKKTAPAKGGAKAAPKAAKRNVVKRSAPKKRR